MDYAAKHRRSIVVENSENYRKQKMCRYVEKSQWSFYQLLPFILYEAALGGVMVIEADGAYTSRSALAAISYPSPTENPSAADIVDTMTTETLTRHSRSVSRLAVELPRSQSALAAV